MGKMETAIEAKATGKVSLQHLKGLRELIKDHPEVRQRVVASLEAKERVTEDGISILPYGQFISQLWKGEIVV